MNTPIDPTGPLQQILAEDAVDLPLKAAREARKARSLHARRRRQIGLTVTVLLCGTCVWQFFSRGQLDQESVAIHTPTDAPITFPEPSLRPFPEPSEDAILRLEAQAMKDPLPLPEGLTKEQEDVVKAAHGLPLLLVRDDTGRVARIHVIER